MQDNSHVSNNIGGDYRWVGTISICDILVHGLMYQAVWISDSFSGWHMRQFRFQYNAGVSSLSAFISWSSCIVLLITLRPIVRRTAYWVRNLFGIRKLMKSPEWSYSVVSKDALWNSFAVCCDCCIIHSCLRWGIPAWTHCRRSHVCYPCKYIGPQINESLNWRSFAGVLLVPCHSFGCLCHFRHDPHAQSVEILLRGTRTVWHWRGLPVATSVTWRNRVRNSWQLSNICCHSSGGTRICPHACMPCMSCIASRYS